MATILSRLSEFVRNELDDGMSSRWTDAQLLIFFKQAVRRANTVGQLNRLKFMRGKEDYTFASGGLSVALPVDFLTPISVTRMDTHTPLTGYDEDQWDAVTSASEASVYLIDGNELEIMGSPVKNIPLRLRYYIHVDPDELTLSSQTPWDGKLDYLLCEYVSLRARKVDRYDISIDSALLNELEKDVLGMYADLAPTTLKSRGWNTVGKG